MSETKTFYATFGSGHAKGGSEPNCNVPPCDTCNGHGEVQNDYGLIVACPDCAGMGYIAPEDDEQ